MIANMSGDTSAQTLKLNRDIASEGEKVKELEREIQALQSEIALAEGALETKMPQLHKEEETEKQKEGEMEKLKAEIEQGKADAKKREFKALNSSKVTLEGATRAKRTFDTKEADLRKTQATIKQKEAAMQKLKEEIDQMKLSVEKIMVEMKASQDEINRAKTFSPTSALNSREQENESRLKTAQIAKLRGEISAAKPVIEKLDHEIAELKRALPQREAKKKELENTLAATKRNLDRLERDLAQAIEAMRQEQHSRMDIRGGHGQSINRGL